MDMNILITGGTGFIGKLVCDRLSDHTLYVLSRKPRQSTSKINYLTWKELEDQLSSLDIQAVINLAGETIAQRWTKSSKERIYSSRIETTKRLIELFKTTPLDVFISASAIGYFGDRGGEILTEDSEPGTGFLSEVCKAWEAEALKARAKRKVILRFGMVLGKDGGALPKMLLPFKLGLGSVFGDGKMWMSWIHVDDLVGIIESVLTKFNGIYNAVAPTPVTNREFTDTLASELQRKAFFSTPALALKLTVGEMSELVLSSQRVLPKKLKDEGFNFRYKNLSQALNDILAQSKSKRKV